VNEASIFYTYIYLDPRKPGSFDYGEFHFDFEPFYVGKGQKNQCLNHLKWAENTTDNSYKLNKIRKIQSLDLEPKVIKYKENLTEEAAFDLEKKIIKVIGRLDLGHGPLTNLTDGGEGIINVIHSKESIERQAVKLRGRKRGTKEDTPWIANMSAKLRGRTKETHPGLARMAEKLTGRTKDNHQGVARQAEKMRVRMLGDSNPVKRLEVRQKLSEKLKGIIPWNKGLTKETNPSVARQAEKMMGNLNRKKKL